MLTKTEAKKLLAKHPRMRRKAGQQKAVERLIKKEAKKNAR
jgi:hypothetical protein